MVYAFRVYCYLDNPRTCLSSDQGQHCRTRVWWAGYVMATRRRDLRTSFEVNIRPKIRIVGNPIAMETSRMKMDSRFPQLFPNWSARAHSQNSLLQRAYMDSFAPPC